MHHRRNAPVEGPVPRLQSRDVKGAHVVLPAAGVGVPEPAEARVLGGAVAPPAPVRARDHEELPLPPSALGPGAPAPSPEPPLARPRRAPLAPLGPLRVRGLLAAHQDPALVLQDELFADPGEPDLPQQTSPDVPGTERERIMSLSRLV